MGGVHNAVASHVHHARRHDRPDEHTHGGDDNNGAELGHLGAHRRVKEVHGVVAHTYKQVEHCQTQQENDDAEINGTHIVTYFCFSGAKVEGQYYRVFKQMLHLCYKAQATNAINNSKTSYCL